MHRPVFTQPHHNHAAPEKYFSAVGVAFPMALTRWETLSLPILQQTAHGPVNATRPPVVGSVKHGSFAQAQAIKPCEEVWTRFLWDTGAMLGLLVEQPTHGVIVLADAAFRDA